MLDYTFQELATAKMIMERLQADNYYNQIQKAIFKFMQMFLANLLKDYE